MFKALMLIFRKKIIENTIVKIYKVMATISAFLQYVLDENADEGKEEIAGVELEKIQSIVRILDVGETILEKAALFLLGLDLDKQSSSPNPLDSVNLALMEADLNNHLDEIKKLKNTK